MSKMHQVAGDAAFQFFYPFVTALCFLHVF
jgi:hypothetical protein